MANIVGAVPVPAGFRERGLKYDVDTIPLGQCGTYSLTDGNLDKTLKSVKGSVVSYRRKHADAKFVVKGVSAPGVLPEGIELPIVAVWRVN